MASRQSGMSPVATDLFGPMNYRGSLPLRVAVYGEVAKAIREGVLELNQLLPPEAELGAAFQVSRSVIREALILLEEDGLILTKRGIGRFVAGSIAEVGLERIQPIERALASVDGEPVTVMRKRAEREGVTDFTRRGLSLADDGSSIFWESIIFIGDRPVALCQEWIPLASTVSAQSIVDELDAAANEGVSMLAVLLDATHSELGPGVCHISVSNAGSDRADMLGISASSPVLLLSQSAMHRGEPLYLAKYMVRPEVGHLAVVQSA